MSAPLPIKTLPVFDAVMRLGGFALAAAELHVTPGAVGQQIQKLEQWLGCSLFVRSVRQVTPTAQARSYWAEVQPALARILQASNGLRASRSNVVRLTMPPSLAAKWFAPRMGDFLGQHPEVSLHLGTSVALTDFEHDGVDLAIRYFDGKDDDLAVELLCRDDARLYGAPDYIRTLRLQTPDDLVRATLIHTSLHPHWAPWMARFSGLTPEQVQAMPQQHVDQSLLAIETARQGQGVVLSSPLLTEVEVRDGRLCEPFPACRLALPKAYYLVHPRRAVLQPAALALKHWLLSRTHADAPHAPASETHADAPGSPRRR